MINFKKLFYRFTTKYKQEKYQKEMYDFLSQAIDTEHLEYLQRQWDKYRGHGAYR